MRSVEAVAATWILTHFLVPLWIAAGLADWMLHRRVRIERNAGPKESLLHILQFVEIGIPLVAVLVFEVNALLFALMIAAFVVHEATAYWDVRYAVSVRPVTPLEQQVHSFLEMIPFTGILLLAVLHWEQAQALFGLGPEPARFELRMKPDPLPAGYVAVVLLGAALFSGLPYLEELRRGLRERAARPSP
jgi:hypothetical protein